MTSERVKTLQKTATALFLGGDYNSAHRVIVEWVEESQKDQFRLSTSFLMLGLNHWLQGKPSDAVSAWGRAIAFKLLSLVQYSLGVFADQEVVS